MDSLRPRGFTSFFKKVWSLTRVSGAVSVDSLTVEIAEMASALLILCFTCAVQIAVQTLHINYTVSPSFHFLSLSIALGFSSLLVAKLVKFKTPKPAKVLHCLGSLSLLLAFFIAISIPYSLYFKIIYFSVFLAILALICYFTIIPDSLTSPFLGVCLCHRPRPFSVRFADHLASVQTSSHPMYV